jgi:UDP-glucose 4-epimerase
VLDVVDAVFHFAVFAHNLHDVSYIGYLYPADNVVAPVRLIELPVASGVKRFFFVNSLKVGGQNVNGETDEIPDGIYGETKREAELKLLEICQQSGMHVSIVRPSLVYGAGAKGNPALMRRGIEQGRYPPLPETRNRRSMIHIDDLLEALLLVAEDERANGEIFIATNSVANSSREIYEAICQAVGKPVPSWSMPKIVFDWAGYLNPRIRYTVDKLLGDEYYSSAKLDGLGFRAKKT